MNDFVFYRLENTKLEICVSATIGDSDVPFIALSSPNGEVFFLRFSKDGVNKPLNSINIPFVCEANFKERLLFNKVELSASSLFYSAIKKHYNIK